MHLYFCRAFDSLIQSKSDAKQAKFSYVNRTITFANVLHVSFISFYLNIDFCVVSGPIYFALLRSKSWHTLSAVGMKPILPAVT